MLGRVLSAGYRGEQDTTCVHSHAGDQEASGWECCVLSHNSQQHRNPSRAYDNKVAQEACRGGWKGEEASPFSQVCDEGPATTAQGGPTHSPLSRVCWTHRSPLPRPLPPGPVLWERLRVCPKTSMHLFSFGNCWSQETLWWWTQLPFDLYQLEWPSSVIPLPLLKTFLWPLRFPSTTTPSPSPTDILDNVKPLATFENDPVTSIWTASQWMLSSPWRGS